MSGQERKAKIPSPPTPVGGAGNLLSSIAPPSQLPNFVTAPVNQPAQPVIMAQAIPQPASAPQVVPQIPQGSPHAPQVVPHSPQVATPSATVPVQPVLVKSSAQYDEAERFSPAIPLSKAEPMMPTRTPEDSQATQSPDSFPESTSEVDQLGDIMPGSGIFSWVKGAVSSGGLLQRVAEKAKSSVDTMITTLDPQMKEYLNSGGDIFLVVASDKEVKISPVREAFQNVFGKATVVGYGAQSDVTAVQPVGHAAAYAAAKQRIAHIRSVHSELTNNVPVIAVEGFLHEAVGDKWYEISLMVLCQPSLGIEILVQSQGTPVPAAAATAAREATPQDYPHLQTGYSLPVGTVMADSLKVHHSQWQEAVTGVSRREILQLAAKSIAGQYKRLLAVSSAET